VTKHHLILASSSPYRQQLLEKLGLPFETVSPDIDESAQPGETPEALVARLAELKAKAAANGYPDALIVGSDQVAVLGNNIIGKPGSHENAVRQLQAASGKKIIFYTGLCLLNSRTGKTQTEAIPYTVVFRRLSNQQIENYLRKERPYSCAGSFKSEGLGITLFKRFEGEDPNTLIGLPLIRLVSMLEREGVNVIYSASSQQVE